MAIDMIENNELGVFTEGRLGFRQFADETRSEDFYNLFGSRNKKKATFREQVRARYDSFPTECSNIQTSIDAISSNKASSENFLAANTPRLEGSANDGAK